MLYYTWSYPVKISISLISHPATNCLLPIVVFIFLQKSLSKTVGEERWLEEPESHDCHAPSAIEICSLGNDEVRTTFRASSFVPSATATLFHYDMSSTIPPWFNLPDLHFYQVSNILNLRCPLRITSYLGYHSHNGRRCDD